MCVYHDAPKQYGRRGDARLTSAAWRVEEASEVADVVRFDAALRGGVGSAKAYGFRAPLSRAAGWRWHHDRQEPAHAAKDA